MGVSSQPDPPQPTNITQVNQTDFWQPFLFETVSKTVLKPHDRVLAGLLDQPGLELDIAPMQHLVELIQKLRSPQLDTSMDQPRTPPELIPYVADEAYEVLESLRELPHAKGVDSALSPLLTETIIPKLLWGIARSSYLTMQMIEGIRVKVCPAEGEDWLSGILRLAILLEITTEEVEWSLDLATGCSQHQLLDRQWLIQAEDDGAVWIFEEPNLRNSPDLSLSWADQHLQKITQFLLAKTPDFKHLLDGMQVELMAPRSSWKSGQVQLKLDYEFIAQSAPPFMATGQIVSNPVEAELLDDLEIGSPELTRSKPSFSQSLPPQTIRTPITVVEMPPQPLVATTIVRLAEQNTIETFAKLATQQELVSSVNWLRSLCQLDQPEVSIAQIVQEAYRTSDMTYRAASVNFCLLQPELLVDELIPKLLWHITRSSYEIAQWVGGVRAAILQPDANWENGTLRLLALLCLETENERWLVDLATGRFVQEESWCLPPTAIAQIQMTSTSEDLLQLNTLQSQLMQTLRSTAPEVALLLEGVVVEWLTAEHDWQLGNLHVTVGFEFSPDLF